MHRWCCTQHPVNTAREDAGQLDGQQHCGSGGSGVAAGRQRENTLSFDPSASGATNPLARGLARAAGVPVQPGPRPMPTALLSTGQRRMHRTSDRSRRSTSSAGAVRKPRSLPRPTLESDSKSAGSLRCSKARSEAAPSVETHCCLAAIDRLRHAELGKQTTHRTVDASGAVPQPLAGHACWPSPKPGQLLTRTRHDPNQKPPRLAAHPVAARTAGRAPAARAHLRRTRHSGAANSTTNSRRCCPPAQLTHAAEAAVLLADCIAAQAENPDRRRLRLRWRHGLRGRCPRATRLSAQRRLSGPEPLHLRLRTLARHRRPGRDAQAQAHRHRRQRHRQRRRRRPRQAARHRHADHRPPPAGRRTAGRRLHRQPEPARLRFPEQASRRRRRDLLRDAGAARRTARAPLVRESSAASPGSPLLDLVALGTVADVVRLDHNNRVLVSQGLKRIRAGPAHPGPARHLSRRRTPPGAGLGPSTSAS
jgi:hypothetical protein